MPANVENNGKQHGDAAAEIDFQWPPIPSQALYE